jgi:hypothetical protein
LAAAEVHLVLALVALLVALVVVEAHFLLLMEAEQHLHQVKVI